MKTNLITGWKMMKVADIAVRISAGGTPRRDKKEYWENGSINWLKISDLKSMYIDETEEKITKLGLENSSAKLFPKGTIVYSIFATLGAVGILNIEATTNQAIVGIVPKKELILNRFLYYCLQAERNKILAKKSHTTQDNLNLTILKNHEIPVPSLSVQERIVSILEKAKKLKELREGTDVLTDTFLKAVFSSMFDHKYRKKKLGELVSKISSGSTPLGGSENYFAEGNILFIRSQNVLMNQFSDHEKLYISEELHQKMKRTWVKKFDVLINITGASIGRTAVYEGEDDMANVNQHVCIIRVMDSNELNPTFLNYFLSSNTIQSRIKAVNAGGTREALNFSQIKNFEIPLPPISLQNEFASIVLKIKSLRTQQAKVKRQVSDLFANLMLKCFRGELEC